MSFFLEDLEELEIPECPEHGPDCPGKNEDMLEFSCKRHVGAPVAVAYRRGEGEMWVACAVCSSPVLRVVVACRDDGRS